MLSDRLERLFDPAHEAAEWRAPLERFLHDTLTRQNAREREARGGFPAREFSELARLGLTEWIVPPSLGGKLEWSTLVRICSRFAEADLAATLCLGGTVLGALPVLLAGSEAQQRQYFEPVRRGAMGGLALSEWAIGSDLNACATQAVSDGRGGFVIDGEKAPINNGAGGANVVILARTHDAADAFSTSLFLLAREQAGLEPHPRVPWIGTKSMDLSGAVLRRAHVPRDALLGKPGEGFVWVRRTLEISRSGVAGMALGAAARALERGLRHAHERSLYGAEIAALDGVRQLLGAAAARTLAITALGRFAAHAVAEAPQGARAWSGAAKLVCTRGAENVVALVGTVLGARSLCEQFDFDDLRRNVCLLPIFDGSSQLQLDELWRVTSAWRRASTRAEPAALWSSAHGDLRGAHDDARVQQNNVPALLADEPLLAELAAWLGAHAGRLRGLGQAQKFEVSELVAALHTYAAVRAAMAVAPDRAPLEAALAAVLAEDAPMLAASLLALAASSQDEALAARLLQLGARKVAAREAMLAIALGWLPS